MKAGIYCVAVLMGAIGMGIAGEVAAENNSSPAPLTTQDTARTDRTIGVCHLVNSLGVAGRDDPLSPVYVISPAGTVSDYFDRFEKQYLGLEGKATLLQAPSHGELKVTASGNYRYTPIAAYIGSDSATFMVEIGGLKVKAIYHFEVIDGGAIGGTEDQDKKNCPNGMFWKISTINDANGNLVVTTVDNQSPVTEAGVFTTDVATLSSSVLHRIKGIKGARLDLFLPNRSHLN